MSGITIFLLIAIGVLIIRTILKFRAALRKDHDELEERSLESKFNIFIEGINQYCFQGSGGITKIDKRTLNIYEDGSRQIVFLKYSTGILTVVWKIKYFQQEMIYKKDLSGARNPTEEWQRNTLKFVISEFIEKNEMHERKVNGN